MHRQKAIARSLIPQRRAQPQQRRRVAAGNQRLVKDFMGIFPFRLQQALGTFDDGQAIKPMMRGQYAALPLHVTLANRVGQRFAFDVQAGGGDVGNFRGGNLPDAEALLVGCRDEATAGQARKRFA
ncbi:hypothetical protein D3C86_1894190 [compost metagenome]